MTDEPSSPVVPSFSAKALRFDADHQVDLAGARVIVFVGANSSGKSTALAAMYDAALAPMSSPTPTVGENVTATLDREGTATDFLDFITTHWRDEIDASGDAFLRSPSGARGPSSLEGAAQFWGNGAGLAQPFGRIAVLCRVENRPSSAKRAAALDIEAQSTQHFIQRLVRNPGLQKSLADATLSAFGTGVFPTWWKINDHELMLGERERVSTHPQMTTLTPESKSYVESCAKVSEAGDGVNAFISVAGETLSPGRLFIAVDEPESQVHPPQARLLGTLLAKQAKGGALVAVATHSLDVLEGLLDASVPTAIVRLARDGNRVHAHVIPPETTAELASKPLLRNSTILSALFFESAVICEGEVDATYLRAFRELIPADHNRQLQRTAFVHCWSKDRLHVAARALRAAGLPVAVVADFDMIRDKAKLTELAVELGLEQKSLEQAATPVRAAVNSWPDALDEKSIRGAGAQLVGFKAGGDDAVGLLRGALRELKNARHNGWAALKESGIDAFQAEHEKSAAQNLIAKCAEGGLHLVPCGEIERFEPQWTLHGPGWLARVESEVGLPSQNPLTIDFLSQIVVGLRAQNQGV